MPSFVWGRDFTEALRNPYEYDAQKQFCREANAFLAEIEKLFNKTVMKYHQDDTTVEKAVWMLHHDAFEALRDCLQLLEDRRHRIAGRLFRDVYETLDIAAYFHGKSAESSSDLIKWYGDEIVPHRRYRDFIKNSKGKETAELSRHFYSSFSKFTHRTYSTLLYSYSLGKNNMLVHDSYSKSKMLVLPDTISAYLALLSVLIIRFSIELVLRGSATEQQISDAWNKSLEEDTVPRRNMFFGAPISYEGN